MIKNSQNFTVSSILSYLQPSCWTFSQEKRLIGSKNSCGQTATSWQDHRGLLKDWNLRVTILQKFLNFTAVRRFFYYILFHSLNMFWGSWPGLKLGFLFCTCRSTYIWQLSSMEILFFDSSKLFSRHSCARWILFDWVGTWFERESPLFKVVTYCGNTNISFFFWCIVAMQICG